MCMLPNEAASETLLNRTLSKKTDQFVWAREKHKFKLYFLFLENKRLTAASLVGLKKSLRIVSQEARCGKQVYPCEGKQNRQLKQD